MASRVGRYKAKREEEQFRKKPKEWPTELPSEYRPVESVMRDDVIYVKAHGAWKILRVVRTNRNGNTVWITGHTGLVEVTLIRRAGKDQMRVRL